jgi:protein-cysteine N-palmitoyltransferase HHAT
MGLLVILHPLLRRVYDTLRPVSEISLRPDNKLNGSSTYTSVANGNARMNQRASFDYGFALVFLAALHGFSAFKVILILYLNFSIATRLPRKFVPVATWAFNIATLFANELCDGYKFAKMAQFIYLAGQGSLEKGTEIQNWGTFLDSYGGIMSRWEILFNITVLRLISYNMDYYWSLNKRAGSPLEVWLSAILSSAPQRHD